MDEFLKLDIFFFVTTIAVVIITALLAILIIYLVKISKDVKYITKKAREEADLISEDLSDLRDDIKAKGFKPKYLLSFFHRLSKKPKE